MATIVVTGANRGIGLELCRAFAARKDRVLAVCRTSSPELAALAVEVIDGIDVASDGGPSALAARITVPIDVLVNNAGVLTVETLDALAPDAIRRQFEVNALGPLRVTHALLPRLGAGAKVALITSRMGSIGDNGSGGYYGYRMSKAALNAAGMSLARDLKGRGIAVAILHPGFVRTEMTRGAGGTDPAVAAAELVARIDALELATTGRFLHANGTELPW